MSRIARAPLWASLALILTVGGASAAQPGQPESDDANVRRKGMDQWLYETHWDASYRRFMNEAAKREREKYGNLIPQSTGMVDGSGGTALNGAVTNNNWTNIGPTNAATITNGSTLTGITDSGRPTAIVSDPGNTNTIYLATAGGGVWKTTDGGTTWAAKTEALGSLSVGHLAMDPANSSVLYLGLGDAFDGTGVGLYKSTDGASSWTGPVYIGNSTVTNKLVVAQAPNNNIVLAATNDGLYRSTDSGATWSNVALATGNAAIPMVWDIAWTGGTSYALSLEANPAATTGSTLGQVFTSANNGQTWTLATGPTVSGGVGRISLASAPSNRSIVYAMGAKPLATTASDLADLFRSTNGGASWTALGATGRKIRYSNSNTESTSPATILNGQGWYNHALIVNPTNANQFFFGGALLLAQATSTNGTSWTYTQKSNWLAQFSLPYVHADFHCATYDVAGNLFVGTDGGIFKSANNGTTFTDDLNVGITSHLIYSVGSSQNNVNAVVGGFQDNGTRVRSGATGTFNQPIGGDGFGSNVNRANAQQMLGSLYYTRIYKSTNGGSTFASSSSGITESNNSSSAPFNTHIVAYEGDATGNTVYTHVNLKVYKSTNYATSWSALGTTGLPTTSFVIRNIGVAPTNNNYLGIAGSGGKVFLSSNGGTSWTQAATPANSNLSMNAVAFDRTSPQTTVYLSSVAPTATHNHLWKSTNFGASWTAIDGGGFPFGVPVNTVTTDPGAPNTVYAATHLGVYRSTDGGTTWARFGANLPLVNVTDLYISPDSTLVRASTFGRGFWELVP